MARWRAKALDLLPEFSATIQRVETPYMLWIELGAEFRRAYGPPADDALTRRFHMYADWCWRQRRQKELDLKNCVAVCFYEHLPDHRATRDDMPRWISREKFEALAGLLEWRLGGDEFNAVKRNFEANADEYEWSFDKDLRQHRRSGRKQRRTGPLN